MSALGAFVGAASAACERFPSLGALPPPAWLQRAMDAQTRRQRLVVEISALAGRDVASLALWIARAYWLGAVVDPASSFTGRVERMLEAFKALALSGGEPGRSR